MNPIGVFHHWFWRVKLHSGEKRFEFFAVAAAATCLVFGIVSAATENGYWILGVLIFWCALIVLYFLTWCAGYAWGMGKEFRAYYQREREKSFEILRR